MKKTNKFKDLLNFGLKPKTILNLTENQINLLHNKLISEENTTGVLNVRVGSQAEREAKDKGLPFVAYEGEVNEKKGKTKKKKYKYNPWAVCTDQLSDEFGTSERSDWTKSQMAKYERCVQGVKKQMKNEAVLEKKIMDIIETTISPEIKKHDLLEYLKGNKKIRSSEQAAPAKPKTRPTVKPGTKKPKRDNPFKPKHKPNPKAENSETLPGWLKFDSIFNRVKNK